MVENAIGGDSLADMSETSFDPNTGGSMLTKILDLTTDPNVHKMMLQAGAAMSAPGSVSHSLGNATADFINAEAVQKAEAKLAGQRQGLAGQIISALKEDPTGKNTIGDPSDPNSINKITMDNKGISLSLPNPDMTKPYQELQDTPGENKTLRPNLNFGATPNPDITAGLTAGDVFGLDAVNSPNSKLDARRDLQDFFKAPKD